jgi:hypothetical protein
MPMTLATDIRAELILWRSFSQLLRTIDTHKYDSLKAIFGMMFLVFKKLGRSHTWLANGSCTTFQKNIGTGIKPLSSRYTSLRSPKLFFRRNIP